MYHPSARFDEVLRVHCGNETAPFQRAVAGAACGNLVSVQQALYYENPQLPEHAFFRQHILYAALEMKNFKTEVAMAAVRQGMSGLPILQWLRRIHPARLWGPQVCEAAAAGVRPSDLAVSQTPGRPVSVEPSEMCSSITYLSRLAGTTGRP